MARKQREFDHALKQIQREETGSVADFAGVPVLDFPLAETFALLLEAGVSPEAAVWELVPEAPAETVVRTAGKWVRDPLVVAAVSRLHGGTWHELSPDQRMSVALGAYRAQCARFLVTHRFDDASAGVLAKLETARAVLEKFTAGGIDPTDPLAAFQRAAEGIMRSAAERKAPGVLASLDEDEAEALP
jgi:hypothetical protein